MPGIGVSGTPANESEVVMVDFVAEHNGLLHLGNNGGLMRATVPRPLDYVNAPHHWTSIVPSHPGIRGLHVHHHPKLTDLGAARSRLHAAGRLQGARVPGAQHHRRSAALALRSGDG